MADIFYNPTVEKSTAQSFTTSWVDLGGEIQLYNIDCITLWLKIVINDSLNARIRFLVKHTKDHADEYILPIETVTQSVITAKGEYFELDNDVDQNIVLTRKLNKCIPFVQVQIQAGTVGATPGQVTDFQYTLY